MKFEIGIEDVPLTDLVTALVEHHGLYSVGDALMVATRKGPERRAEYRRWIIYTALSMSGRSMIEIGEALREKRLASNLTIGDVARKFTGLGVSPSDVSNMERGERPILPEIADFFGVVGDVCGDRTE